MSSCIFCRIVQGDVPSTQVYSSSNVLAFLDVAPVHFGHVLVIPRAHYPTLWDLPSELGNELLEALCNVSVAVRRATQASGLNVMMNNLKAAGQLVDHAHFHLIPRHDNDGLQLWPQSAYPDQEKMRQVAEAIKAELV